MKVILENINFTRQNFSLNADGEFHEGIHLITGIVGCGKSTLALLMAGFLQPKLGIIERQGIGSLMLSLQFPEYHVTGLTVSQECRSWGCDPDTILSQCELLDKNQQYPLSLSRGELKKLHLACILQKSYDLLLLDEPFSALDPEEKLAFCDRVERKTNGITIIFTHEQTFLPRVDNIWEIIDGKLHEHGPLPVAIECWHGAPPLIRKLVESGKTPRSLSYREMSETTCRT